MITEDYVSFETAKLLKEKGFDVPDYYCSRVYNEHGTLQGVSSVRFPKVKYISAPTLQMAMKWLREEHNCFIQIREYFVIKKYQAFVSKCGETTYCEPDWFHPICNSYEEACEAAIRYCLENLI
jgi:hypothetical protein